MYGKVVDIEKLARYAGSEWPNIYFLEDDTKGLDGCVDCGGLIDGEYLDEVGLDESVLGKENPVLEICRYLLENAYSLFVSLGEIESMEEFGETGKYYIGDEKVEIDVEELFRKPKVFKTDNKVEFFTEWDVKYLDESKYRICSNDCRHCFYCLDEEFEYTIAFPATEDKKFNRNLITPEIRRAMEMAKIKHGIDFMEDNFDVVMAAENEFRGYTSGFYGVFVKNIDGKNLMDYGYLSEVGGPVCFVGPSLDFYHLDDIESDDDIKKTFIKLIDGEDIYE